MTGQEYYTVQCRKALQNIRSQIQYCTILLPFVDIQEVKADLREADKVLTHLIREVNHRQAELDRHPQCDPEHTTGYYCKDCKNFDVHYDGGTYCKLTLKAMNPRA